MRLIGFGVVTSTNQDSTATIIAEIRPIYYTPQCHLTDFDFSSIPTTMSVGVGQGSVSTTLYATDSMSFAYGSMDGTSFCGRRYWSVQDEPYWIDV